MRIRMQMRLRPRPRPTCHCCLPDGSCQENPKMSRMGGTRIGCAEFRRHLRLSRRSFLQAGLLGTAGLGLADLLRHEARATPATAVRQPSVIILWMRGGPSHIDMWDPKPDAPVEY